MLYATKCRGLARILLTLWFVMIGASVLTTYQHHFIDLPTGFALGWLCVWLWPAPSAAAGPVSAWRYTADPLRHRLALAYLAGALSCAQLRCGPAAGRCGSRGRRSRSRWCRRSMQASDPTVSRRTADGRLSAATLAARAVSCRRVDQFTLWTRRAPQPVLVADGVWIGRMPTAHDRRLQGIVDVAAEMSLPRGNVARRVVPMLDLVRRHRALAHGSSRHRAAARGRPRARVLRPWLLAERVRGRRVAPVERPRRRREDAFARVRQARRRRAARRHARVLQ